MASIIHDANGYKRIQFLNPDGVRKTIRLGKVSDRIAESFEIRIRDLVGSLITKTPVEPEVLRWVADLADPLHEKLARAGLVPSRASTRITVDQLTERFIAAKTVKASTAAVYDRVRRSLIEHFGPNRQISEITTEDADKWRRTLADQGFARATQSKLTHIAKQMFSRAVKWEYLRKSPFADMKPGPQDNPARKAFVTREVFAKVLDQCPSPTWKALFALARFGGLRCPSEVMALTWRDVNFDESVMMVRSSKTEHHAGGAARMVPMIEELHAIMLDAFHAAPPGSVHVIDRVGRSVVNFRTQATRIIESAAVPVWPKVFVNLRASIATEWAAEFGAYTAGAWLGHSPRVASTHYHTVRQSDFERATGKRSKLATAANGQGTTDAEGGANCGALAAQKAAQTASTGTRQNTSKTTQTPADGGVRHAEADCDFSGQNRRMGATGLEPVTSAM